MQRKFSEPGSDGDLSHSNIWKKGIVFTRRASPVRLEAGYRISVAFKRRVSSVRPVAVFTTCTIAFSLSARSA
jgi:hypothetical protein